MVIRKPSFEEKGNIPVEYTYHGAQPKSYYLPTHQVQPVSQLQTAPQLYPRTQPQQSVSRPTQQSRRSPSPPPPPLPPPRQKKSVPKAPPSQHASPIPLHKPMQSGVPAYGAPPPYIPGNMTTDQLQYLKLQCNSESPMSSHSPSPASSVNGQISHVFNGPYASPTPHVAHSPRPAPMYKSPSGSTAILHAESKEVHFPEAQTATAPSLPPHRQHHLNNHSLHTSTQHNTQPLSVHPQYYQPSMNPSASPAAQYIPHTQQAIPNQHNGTARHSAGQSVQRVYNTNTANNSMRQQNYMHSSMYHQSELPLSVRQDSSQRMVANQSPVSVHSTTSAHSTNSDIPATPLHEIAPPPPYHGPHNPAQNSQRPPSMYNPSYQQPPTQPTNNTQSCLAYLQNQNDHQQYQVEEPELPDVLNADMPVGEEEKEARTSPKPDRDPEAQKKEKEGQYSGRLKSFSSQAYKFFMEQHIENIFKSYEERKFRMEQLHKELANTELPEATQKQMIRLLHQKESNYLRLKRANMNKMMFEEIKPLGVGAFGSVTLVRKGNTQQLYAMKTLRKSDVLKRNQIAHVKAERDILAEADNEWVVKLYYSFQDREHLYFVMDYIQGGDMMGRLQKEGIFEAKLAQFYIAELVLAVESVHSMGFIHRDIKPDNILIDKDGHIKLTDFGLCTGFRWTHNSKLYQKGIFISN